MPKDTHRKVTMHPAVSLYLAMQLGNAVYAGCQCARCSIRWGSPGSGEPDVLDVGVGGDERE